MSSDPGASRSVIDRTVDRDGFGLSVRDYPGAEPAIVLLHGFPDNQDLYDRLVPSLSPRRVVTFDFLGWGMSDKPRHWRYTSAKQERDLDAVVEALHLDQFVLVAHDASGPPAINWSLLHPDRLVSLVLLNTYYGLVAPLRRPPAIALYSTPALRNVARGMARRSPRFDRWLFARQVGQFVRDPDVRFELVPALYGKFGAARPAFFDLNTDLLPTVRANTRRHRRLAGFTPPVQIIFGQTDRYLNVGVAQSFHRLLPSSSLHLIKNAGHYVQVDEPERVAEIILSAAS